MSKKIIRLTESELVRLVNLIIEENDNMGSKCTFTLSQLFKKNDQGLTGIPKTFTVKYVKGFSSIKKGSSVNMTQKITMGAGEIIFEDIEGFGQASISCDGSEAEISVAWE